MQEQSTYPIIHEQTVAWGIWMLLAMSIMCSIIDTLKARELRI